MLEVADRRQVEEEVGLNGDGVDNANGNGNAVAVGGEGLDMMDDEIS